MKGNIRKRGEKQAWQITVWTGDKKSDGKPIRHFETVRGRKSDAQRRLRELLTNLDKGTYTPPTTYTVKDILYQWLDSYCRTKCTPRTTDGYESVARLHLVPSLGHILLKDLQPRTIQSCYGVLCETLSNRTVLHVHRLLSQALKWAIRQNYIGRNPADLVDPPSPRGRTMCTLSAFEVGVLLDNAQDNYYYPVIYTAVSTGLRRNELLALRWRDIDLDLLSVSVSQTLYKGKGRVEFKEPKTKYSRRRVSMTPKLALFLREYKAEKESLFWQLGVSPTLDDLVFSDINGKPIDPSTLTHNFGRIVKSAGLSARFHDLRHSYASLMLAAGVHPKVVSEALGHSTVAITLDIYSHVTPGLQEAAAKQLDAVLPVGVAQRQGSGTGMNGGEVQL
ncbi:tyrosine-type recombinase/integrase [Chloroflexota bacterium]